MKDLAQHTFYKSLGARVRELRDGLTLSQEQLAEAVKLTRTSIVNIEAGRQKVLVHNLFLIAETLGVRPTDLLAPLERKRGEIPVVDIRGTSVDTATASRWVEKIVNRAIKSTPPHDPQKTNPRNRNLASR